MGWDKGVVPSTIQRRRGIRRGKLWRTDITLSPQTTIPTSQSHFIQHMWNRAFSSYCTSHRACEIQYNNRTAATGYYKTEWWFRAHRASRRPISADCCATCGGTKKGLPPQCSCCFSHLLLYCTRFFFTTACDFRQIAASCKDDTGRETDDECRALCRQHWKRSFTKYSRGYFLCLWKIYISTFLKFLERKCVLLSGVFTNILK